MKKEKRHTNEYKQVLIQKKDDIKLFVEKKTGYQAETFVEYDKEIGFCYAVRLSLDNFETFAKFILKNTTKDKLKGELLSKLIGIDIKQKKIGQSTNVTKAVQSTKKIIECQTCGELKKPACFHRNLHSELFKRNGGFVFSCHDCCINVFSKILCKKDIYTAFCWITGFYGRKYDRELIEKVEKISSTPFQLVQTYFSRLNLQKGKTNNTKTFADSDIFIGGSDNG